MAVDWFSVMVQLTEIQCLYSRNPSTSITRPSPMNASFISFFITYPRQTQSRCHLQGETQKRLAGQSSCPFHLSDRWYRPQPQLSQLQQFFSIFVYILLSLWCISESSSCKKNDIGQQNFTTHVLSFAPQDVLRYNQNEGMPWPSFPTMNEEQ